MDDIKKKLDDNNFEDMYVANKEDPKPKQTLIWGYITWVQDFAPNLLRRVKHKIKKYWYK